MPRIEAGKLGMPPPGGRFIAAAKLHSAKKGWRREPGY